MVQRLIKMQNMDKIQMTQAESIRLGRCMNIAAELKGQGTNKTNKELAKDIKDLAKELYVEESQLELEIMKGKVGDIKEAQQKMNQQPEQPKQEAPKTLEI
jgi:DNA-binding Xre family transcriptional regulator